MNAQPQNRERRNLLNWFLGTSVGALLVSIVYPVARYVSPPDVPEADTQQVQAGPINDAELLEKGFKIIRFGSEPVILVRVDEKDFRAFSGTCTHLDCIVEYQKDQRRIWCNCHNGEYDLQGRNVKGPPPKPLEAYQVDLVSEGSGSIPNIVVSRV